MKTFKSLAYEILKEAGKSLHVREITKRALERGLITEGKTPEATMLALLIVDTNTKKDSSKFIKTGPSIFGINPNPTLNINVNDVVSTEDKVLKIKKEWKISKDVSSKQKGDIAEARIAELVTLYGDTTLSCYKPISDDEGIDLIVKEKGSLKTMYIQVKSRFGDDPRKIFTATAKFSGIVDHYSMAMVFCYFNVKEGDIWDFLWFVPAPDFIKFANRLSGEEMLGFVAGRKRNEANKWDQFLIEKQDLANKIIAQMKRI